VSCSDLQLVGRRGGSFFVALPVLSCLFVVVVCMLVIFIMMIQIRREEGWWLFVAAVCAYFYLERKTPHLVDQYGEEKLHHQ